jgi:hypothetical protein
MDLCLLVLLLELIACPVLHHRRVAFLVGIHVLRNHMQKTQILMKLVANQQVKNCIYEWKYTYCYMHVLPRLHILGNANVELLGVPITNAAHTRLVVHVREHLGTDLLQHTAMH